MPRSALPIVFLFLASASAAAQPSNIDTTSRRQAVEKLRFLIGDWGGEATAFIGPGQQIRMWQTEWVRPKVMGQILAVEGLGRRLTPSGPADTVFNAFGTIDWTPERGYQMRTQIANGHVAIIPLQVSDSGFTWGIDVPGGRSRYTMRITPAGEWHERGEFSRDGQQWFPIMEMRLKRTEKATP